MKVDHIIVGQGLAGSCLALQMLKRGKKILVFDEPKKNNASTVAAGLYNPITGKRMTKSWCANLIFPYLSQFYKDAEESLNQKFFYPMPIYRPFVSIEEQNEWMALSETAGIKEFIERIFTTNEFDYANDPFGGVLTRQSGYVDVNLFMGSVRNLLERSNSYLEKKFEATELNFSSGHVKYESIETSSVVFCDGLGANKNPYFHWLPIRPLKGETLSILIEEKPEVIFNRGVYLVPNKSDNSYTVGATYQPNDMVEEISEKAKKELEDKLGGLIRPSYKIHHQNWGIRPTTPDRKPLLGAHPEQKNVLIFNGLGTKGVSLSPYFSHVLCDWMEGKTEIGNEVNIERFKALYSNLSSL